MKDEAKLSYVLSGLLVFSLVFSPAILSGRERRGANISVVQKDGPQIDGELIAVRQSSLLVLGAYSGRDFVIDVQNIKYVKIIKKSYFWPGVGLGLGAGLLISWATLDPHSNPGGDWMGGMGAAIERAEIAIGTTFALALVGGLFGAEAGKDRVIEMEGISTQEIGDVLEKLRRKARVTNAQ